MFHKKVDQYPLWAWIFVGMTAPLAQIAGRSPWLGTAVFAVVSGCLCWGVHSVSGETPSLPKWCCILEYFFIIFVAGELAGLIKTVWPTGGDLPTVPLTLLFLAALSAWHGAERASRIGGVLFWFIVILYAVILGAGVKELNPRWMIPDITVPEGLLLVVLLIPAVAVFLPREKGRLPSPVLTLIGIFAGVVALWTAGTLSPRAVKSLADPFYEFSKSLSLFGVAERFEAIVSFTLTLGYFALFSLLFSAAGTLAEGLHQGFGRWGIVLGSAVSAFIAIFFLPVSDVLLALLSLVFWGILPFLLYCVKRAKAPNNKKSSD